MKNLLLLLLLLLIGSTSLIHAQNTTTKKMLSEIEGKWELDDNGNVTYSEVIEVDEMSEEEIYNRALNYFVYNYGSGKSVIQTQDKELGRIVAKGLTKNIHTHNGLWTSKISFWHIARVDVKEGRARIIFSIIKFEDLTISLNGDKTVSDVELSKWYPIDNKGRFKNARGQGFYKSHFSALASIDAIKKSILEGNTSESIENDDW